MPKFLLLAVFLFLSAPCQAASLEQTFAEAQAAFKSGNFIQAGELFTAAGNQLAKRGDASRASLLWGNAAVAYLKAENYESAANLYEKILAANKRLPKDQALRVYKNLAICRTNLKQPVGVISTVEQMLKVLPNLPAGELADAYARLGDAYRALELYGRATSAYEKAAKIIPQNSSPAQRAKILTALGLCQGNLGSYDQAIVSLEQARDLAKELQEQQTVAEANSNLGLLYLERGDYPKALELINAALEEERKAKLRRNEGVDENNIALVHKAIGNHEEALRHVKQSLSIAKEVGNLRDEGIATVNQALINRILGNFSDSRADYRTAQNIFEQCGFQEGSAGAYLGIGRMEALADKNYTLAIENYQKALEIYKRLSLLRGQVETALQLGEAYKYVARPGRTTRDMTFDEEPTLPDITPNKAIELARSYFNYALFYAEKMQSLEMIWSAHQGLGYADYLEGKLEEALSHYQKAIDIVTSMYLGQESVQLFGEFMTSKKDLFDEAQEVCAALYKKTKDKKYQDLMLKYSETFRNEVQKASAAKTKMSFENKDKQALYDKLFSLGCEQEKVRKSVPCSLQLSKQASREEQQIKSLTDKETAERVAVVHKLDVNYKKLLNEWKKKYPEDGAVFDSDARIEINTVQKYLKPEWVSLKYTQLSDKLIITVIAKDKLDSVEVDVKKKVIDNLIKKNFLVDYIEKGYGRKGGKMNKEQEIAALKDVSVILNKLYKYLIAPIESNIAGMQRLYIISDGFLAQTPFGALVATNVEKPDFLIEKYDICYLRPSFINVLERPKRQGKIKKLLAIANPDNKNFWMQPLIATINEIKNVNNYLDVDSLQKNIGFSLRLSKKDVERSKYITSREGIEKNFPGLKYPPEVPTENWLRKQLQENNYEIIYFATHGMPYSDTLTMKKNVLKEAMDKEITDMRKVRFLKMIDNSIKEASPYNGFIYLSSNEGDDILERPIQEQNDGLLTLKEIRGLDRAFDNTRYVILSACNTGVTFAPKALVTDSDETMYSDQSIEKEIVNYGMIPGVDQVSFVDTFMSRGIENAYGTFWFADDKMSGYLLSLFFEKLVEQGDEPDAVSAFSYAQRKVVQDGKNEKKIFDGYRVPHHPFLWAVGGIFGK